MKRTYQLFRQISLAACLMTATISQVGAHTVSPVTPNAMATTRAIYNWMAHLPNRSDSRLLSGAFGGYANIGGDDAFSLAEAENIAARTGQYPAIYACDYARGWDRTSAGNEADLVDYSCNSTLIDYWKKGGLVQISHHLPNPVFAGNDPGTGEGGLKKAVSNEQLAAVLQSGTPERTRWLAILDKVAAGLMQLQQQGVVVLYRPLHEMNGEWFWWGATGYNTHDTTRMNLYIRLYRDIYTYFTRTKGLNNLLWVYAPDANRQDKTGFYPGDAYVDIAGLDMYLDNPANLSGYDEMLRLNKPFALTEVGPSTTNQQFDYARLVSIIKSNFPKTVYFLPWNNVWSPVKNLNASAAYNDSSVVNRGGIWNGSQLTPIVEEIGRAHV